MDAWTLSDMAEKSPESLRPVEGRVGLSSPVQAGFAPKGVRDPRLLAFALNEDSFSETVPCWRESNPNGGPSSSVFFFS